MPHPPKTPFWWMVKAGKDGEGSPHKKTAVLQSAGAKAQRCTEAIGD